MRLQSIRVENFRRVRRAQLSLEPGINVLYGPNDLGKSTIAEAIRAAFLIQVSSTEAKKFVPWNSDLIPFVQIVFDVSDHTYQLTKTFTGPKATSRLEESAAGTFVTIAEGRVADDRARKILGWGLPPLGGKGRQSSETWLTVALLGRQDEVARILETDLSNDPADTGRDTLTKALDAMSQDARVTQLITQLEFKLAPVFNEQGKLRRAENSPLVAARKRIEERETLLTRLDDQRQNSQRVEMEVLTLGERRDRIALTRDQAKRKLSGIKTTEDNLRRHSEVAAEVERWGKEVDRIRAVESELAVLDQKLVTIEPRLREARTLAVRTKDQVELAETAMSTARIAYDDARLRLERAKASEIEGQARRRLELENVIAAATQRTQEAEECIRAFKHAEECAGNHENAKQEVENQRSLVLELTTREEQAMKDAQDTAQKAAYIAVIAALIRVGTAKQRLEQVELACKRTEDSLREARQSASPEHSSELQRTVTRLVRIESEERRAKEWLRDASYARERVGAAEALRAELNEAEHRFEVTNQELRSVLQELKGFESKQIAVPSLSSGVIALASALLGGIFIFLLSRNPALSIAASLLGALLAYWLTRRFLRMRTAALKKEALHKERMRLEEVIHTQEPALNRQRDAVQRTIAERSFELDGDPIKDVPLWEEKRSTASKERTELEGLIRTLETRAGEDTRRTREEADLLRTEHETNVSHTRLVRDELAGARELLAAKRTVLDGLRNRADGGSTAFMSDGTPSTSILTAARARLNDAIRRVDTLQVLSEQAQAVTARSQSVLPATAHAVITQAAADKKKAQEELTALATMPSSIEALERTATSARSTCEEIARRIEEIKHELVDHETAAATLDREFNNREVERETKRVALATHDKDECQRSLLEARQRLALLPPLTNPPTMSSQSAELELQRQDEELKRAEEALYAQQGQLQLLGGAVIAEQCEIEREVLDRLRAEASELEEEMEALRLLLNTLKEQDSVRSSNLGAVLARPVTERFLALAGPRYKHVAIDVGLTSAGVEAGGQRRDVRELSVGTKEQLAMLFRVVVASLLRTTLLLDDQLVQSDPSRLRWFRDEFQRCTEGGTQIIIFTCRPDDYLAGFEGEVGSSKGRTVPHAVDLSQCITCE